MKHENPNILANILVNNKTELMPDATKEDLVKEYAKIIDDLREENKDLRERNSNQAESINNYYKELNRLAMETHQLKNEI